MRVNLAHPCGPLPLAASGTAIWNELPAAAQGQLPKKGGEYIAAYLQFGNITSATFTLSLTINGVARNSIMWTDSGVRVASGGTGTPTDGLQFHFFFPPGTTKVTVTENGGGTVDQVELFLCPEATALFSAILTALVASGITIDSEFPAAETPADNLTNATQTTRVNALAYLFDGTTWDRWPGNSSDGGRVNPLGIRSVLAHDQQIVSTTVLRVLAASSWSAAGASGNNASRRTLVLTNQSTSLYAYYGLIVQDAAANSQGTLSATLNDGHIPPRGTVILQVGSGVDVVIVRDSVSTDVVDAKELS